MLNPRVASRYAKSLIDLSIERGELEKVFEDMQWLQSVCKSNRDVVNLLKSPVIKGDTKKKILKAIIGDNVSPITSGFINLLVTKGRESNLPEVASAFISSYKQKKNIHTVKITTATPLTDNVKNEIITQIKTSAGY